MSKDDGNKRLLFIELAPGVERRHVLSYLFAAFVSIGLFTYLTTLTPYIFRVNLGLDPSLHGKVQGDLQFWQEVIMLAVISFWGALSDRFGRRPVYVIGFLIMALSYALYPLSTNTPELFGARLVFGLGLAATSAMLATIIGDYPTESSRGKLTGVAFFLNGLGAVLFFTVLSRLPKWYQEGRAPGIETELAAGRFAYFVVAGIAFVAALVMLGLKGGKSPAHEARTPLLELVGEGIRAARNPRIALAYASSVAARGDMAIVSMFLLLWAVNLAVAQGLNAAEATARGSGMVVGIAMGTALVWAPFFGWLGDKLNRVTVMIVAFLLATIGYAWIALTPNVIEPSAIPALMMLGVGQSSAILATTLLIGQEAPAAVRGSVFGVHSFCGAIGILLISVFGGRAFDSIGPHAPFWIMAATNGVLFVWAALLRTSERKAQLLSPVLQR